MPKAAAMTGFCPVPLDDAELAATWSAAWSSLRVQAPGGLQSELMNAWSEPHSSYHDQRHLRECLALWARWQGHSKRPGEIAIALWFHDAICDPRHGSNELNSAAWAALGSSPDAQLLVDIDLSILGSPAERFERYDQNVRKDYAWVPGCLGAWVPGCRGAGVQVSGGEGADAAMLPRSAAAVPR